jgi:hypothetical protein
MIVSRLAVRTYREVANSFQGLKASLFSTCYGTAEEVAEKSHGSVSATYRRG